MTSILLRFYDPNFRFREMKEGMMNMDTDDNDLMKFKILLCVAMRATLCPISILAFLSIMIRDYEQNTI